MSTYKANPANAKSVCFNMKLSCNTYFRWCTPSFRIIEYNRQKQLKRNAYLGERTERTMSENWVTKNSVWNSKSHI